MNVTGKLGSSNLSISTTMKKVESSNAISINGTDYEFFDGWKKGYKSFKTIDIPIKRQRKW